MIRGIDHLVIACADPEAAAAALASQLGLSAGGGGRHAGRGTWNRIVWLADGSYLELIGVDDPELAGQSPVGAAAVRTLHEHGGGLATYALRVDDLAATVDALRAGDSSIGPATHGSRTRDDGEVVDWWTAVPDSDLGADGVPFLIEHAHSGAEWGPGALEQRATFAHPIGSPVSLARLDIASPEPPSSAATIHAELGIEFWAVADLAVANVGPHVLRLVPSREMATTAVVTLAADVDAARQEELLGLRFDVERAAVPVADRP